MQKRALLVFPTEFAIKVFGKDGTSFETTVVAIIAQHDIHVCAEQIRARRSQQGKYLSLTITLFVQSQDQLDAIYRDLSAHEQVVMAL